MVSYSISGTAPLRGLSMLSELRMLAAPPAGPHEDIDLADIADSRIRLLWISNAPVLRHMEALLDMRCLRNIRLIECHLDDAGRRVLDSLPARVKVKVS
jgi:hypothetical protein